HVSPPLPTTRRLVSWLSFFRLGRLPRRSDRRRPFGLVFFQLSFRPSAPLSATADIRQQFSGRSCPATCESSLKFSAAEDLPGPPACIPSPFRRAPSSRTCS